MKLLYFYAFVLVFISSSCMKNNNMVSNLDIQGHRGCRGLLPENTIPAFKRAIDFGVTTLEMDAVVNHQGHVIISHEPFFNHEISSKPDGSRVAKNEELDINLYPMTLDSIKQYDVGMVAHPRFPIQKKIKVSKPTLEEVVTYVAEYCKEKSIEVPLYNIEIKRVPEHDGIFHPKMKEFANAVCNKVIDLGIAEKTTIQCFDIPTLQYVNEKYPELPLVLLIQNRKPFKENISALGFKPAVYSSYYALVTDQLIEYCKKEDIKVIPWTVNEPKDIENLILMGVDGIISDYPDRVIEIYSSLKKG